MAAPTVHDPRPTLVLAGATGFIGQALAAALRDRYRVVGLSRQGRAPDHNVAEYRACDLFNLREAEAGLDGADYAVYLLHSMMPSARLTQGSFADMDLICADNFARAARKSRCRQIVYLGGLIPDGPPELSSHLASRLEVERTLGRYGTPLTAVRAGLILGARGSSFQILLRLVERLPAMLLPAWTRTRTQPVALDDVVALLAFAVANERCFGRSFDVGTPEPVSWAELIQRLAVLMERPLRAYPVPFLSPRLSRLWVSLVTGAPRALVEPLIDSLRHEMVARDHELARLAGRPPITLDEALRRSLAQARALGAHTPHAFAGAPKPKANLVRSVQRMRLPAGRDADWAAAEYARWLPRGLRGLVRVEVDADRTCHFFLALLGTELLTLAHAAARSSADRQLYFIRGGRLAKQPQAGRFELRQLLDGRTLMTAIHDYAPELPWPLYIVSQARFHAWVMSAFSRHLLGDRSLADPLLRHVVAAPTERGG